MGGGSFIRVSIIRVKINRRYIRGKKKVDIFIMKKKGEV